MEKEKGMTIDTVPILLRREIEATYIKPFLEAFSKEIGKEKTLEITRGIIEELALEEGRRAALRAGGNTLEDLDEITKYHDADGSLDVERSAPADNQRLIKTIRCSYCDLYERLGMKELGTLLSCHRDAMYFKGVNPNFEFRRSEVLMNGGSCCDSLIIEKEGGQNE